MTTRRSDRSWIPCLLAGCTALLAGAVESAPAQVTVRRHLGVATNENFGYALAGIGDVDLDGAADYAVGAPTAAAGGANSGRVDVFSGATGAPLVSFGGAPGQRLGWALSGGFDATGDGIPDLVAGSATWGGGGGAVEVRSGATGQQAAVIASTVPGFGQNVLMDDLDGQGTAEIVIVAPSLGAASVHAGNGALLLTVATPVAGGFFGPFGAVVSDVNGDGWRDIVLAYGPGTASAGIFSGATGVLIRPLSYPGAPANQNRPIACPGDLDGDGTGDVVLQLYPGAAPTAQGLPEFVAFSGATGAVIWILARDLDLGLGSTSVDRLAPLDDVTGDGVPDVAIAARSCCAGSYGSVVVVSGADGTFQRAVRGSGTYYASHLASVGDLDGDGRRDLLEGEFDFNQNTLIPRASVIATRNRPTSVATATMLGAACPPAPGWPIFRTDTVPRLGTTITLLLSRAPAVPGFIVLAPGWPSPQAFGACTVWPDLALSGSWLWFPTIPSATGSWPLALPANPALTGAAFTLQMALQAPAGPILTGGILAILGF